jgi:phosphoenolpyruvate-protein phosphotransferase
MSERQAALILRGKSISPGLAEGLTYVHRDRLHLPDAPVSIETKDVDGEVRHLEVSTAAITEDLLALATRVEREMDANLAAVFDAHQQMLNDPVLKAELRVEIRGNLVSARSAVKSVFLRWERRFLEMESRMGQQKGADMRDISNRLSSELAGIHIHPLEKIPSGSVLVARRLLPSDTVFLAKCSAAAVLLENGHAGSHAALFVRAMGLPCITNIRDILTAVPANVHALVNADLGDVLLSPTEADEARFRHATAERSQVFAAALARAREPAMTRDGVAIAVLANAGCREDVERAMKNGADGIGLYRTEQMYLGRTEPPDADELLSEMREALEPAKGKPVCVRLLDVGADKPLPYIGFLAETNPALGRRGIRLLNRHRQLMETQLRMILTLADDFDMSILIPMVTLPDDLAAVREDLVRIGAERGGGALPRLGAMIETPAAALSVRDIAPQVDFISFGTNDLTQYAFAADRDNAAVEMYFNDSSAVIFRLLQIARDDAPRMPLAICGELAGRAAHVAKLLRCGIRTLSVAPPLIPLIKEAVRSSSIE